MGESGKFNRDNQKPPNPKNPQPPPLPPLPCDKQWLVRKLLSNQQSAISDQLQSVIEYHPYW